MTLRHLFRHLVYSHVLGSYSAGVIGAGFYSAGHISRFISCAFPVFIGPLVFPLSIFGDDERQFFWMAIGYVVVFTIVLAVMRGRQSKFERAESNLIALAQQEPLPVISLEYQHSPPQVERYGRMVSVTIVSALVVLFAATGTILVMARWSNLAEKLFGIWTVWALLVPASTAMCSGLIASFQTKAGSKQRNAATIGFTIGLVMTTFLVYMLYSHLTGLDHYD